MQSFLQNLKNSSLLSNFGSLLLLQGAKYILPLISFPYLYRTLGEEKYGLITFAMVFIMYFVMISDFGFGLSATHQISAHRNDKEKINELFTNILAAKVVLMIVCFFIMTAIVLYFDKFSKNATVYFLTYGVVVGDVLFPIWFFQGMEKMKFITIVNTCSRFVFVAGVFLFIQGEDDYLVAPILNTLGYGVAAILSLIIIYKRFGVRLTKPKFSLIWAQLRKSADFFLSRVSVSLYTLTNTFILGLFGGDVLVAHYALAEKLYNAMQGVWQALSSVAYPFMVNKKDIKFFKKIIVFASLAGVVGSLALSGLAPFIMNLLFKNVTPESITAFRALLIVSIINVPAILIGYPLLGAMGHTKYVNMSVIIASVGHLIGLGILAFLGQINIYTVPAMVIITEGIVLIIRTYGVHKFKVLK